jgi:membrane fusion protein
VSAEDETPLFRKEALEAAGSRLGSAIKPVSVTGLSLTLFLAALLGVASVFLATAQYARKETVVGALEPSEGAARIISPKVGVVTAIKAAEGQYVREGAPLFVINQDLVTENGASLGQLLTASTSAQKAALAEEITARRQSTERQRNELLAKRQGLLQHQTKLGGDLDLQSARLKLQQQSLESFKTLVERKIVSDLQYRDRQDAVLQARQTLSAIEKDKDETASSLAQIDAELARLDADLSQGEAQIRASRAQVSEREASNAASKEIVISAPKSGRLVAISAKLGGPVVNSAALAILLPEGVKLHAELWAPSRAAGFVRVGDPVRLMLDAFPYQKFGVVAGKVSHVAAAPTPPGELTIPIETKESLYRIDVDLDRQDIDGYGKRWDFSPGMRLNADLILDKRTFLEWLLDPVLASMKRGAR